MKRNPFGTRKYKRFAFHDTYFQRKYFTPTQNKMLHVRICDALASIQPLHLPFLVALQHCSSSHHIGQSRPLPCHCLPEENEKEIGLSPRIDVQSPQFCFLTNRFFFFRCHEEKIPKIFWLALGKEAFSTPN